MTKPTKYDPYIDSALHTIREALQDLVNEITPSNTIKWYGTDIDLYYAEQSIELIDEILANVPDEVNIAECPIELLEDEMRQESLACEMLLRKITKGKDDE